MLHPNLLMHPDSDARNRSTARNICQQITINDLPLEILGEIFVRCTPLSQRILPPPYIINAPMLLCRVCRHWRETALSMPILWATFSARPAVAFRSYQMLMKMWLELSKACPLTLDVKTWCSTPLSAISPIFFSEIHRWRNVSLQLCKDTAGLFHEKSHGGASHLERLLLGVDDCTDEQIIGLPNTVSKFTTLCDLALYSHRKIPIPEFMWSHLTSVDLQCQIAADQCIEILAQCTNIVNCFLGPVLPPNKTVAPTQVALQALTTLTLYSDRIDIGYILARLTCPLLGDLYIEHRPWGGALDVDAFGGFLSRLSRPLKKLEIIDLSSPEEKMVDYLKSPGLQHAKSFKLFNYRWGDKLVGALTHPTVDDADAIMPLLEKISLNLCNSADSTFGMMVASRFGKTPLKELDVKFLSLGPHFRGRDWHSKSMAIRKKNFEQLHERDLEIFEEVRRDGMKITWSF